MDIWQMRGARCSTYAVFAFVIVVGVSARRKHTGMKLELPPGYYLDLDADVLTLRRKGGCMLAVFSVRGATRGAIEEEAWADHLLLTQPKRLP